MFKHKSNVRRCILVSISAEVLHVDSIELIGGGSRSRDVEVSKGRLDVQQFPLRRATKPLLFWERLHSNHLFLSLLGFQYFVLSTVSWPLNPFLS